MMETGLQPWHLWVILGVLLLTLEIFVPGFVLAGLGFAAVCAALVHYFSGDFGWALAAFSAGALVFFIGIRPLALRTFMQRGRAPFGIHGMVGKQVKVMGGPDVNGRYHTVFRDSRWRLESEEALNEGDLVEVVAVRTSTFIVKHIPR